MRKYRNRLRRMKQFWSIRYFIRIPGGAWEVKKDLLHSVQQVFIECAVKIEYTPYL